MGFPLCPVSIVEGRGGYIAFGEFCRRCSGLILNKKKNNQKEINYQKHFFMVDEDKLVEHPLPSLWLTNIITKLLGPVHFQLNCSESVFLPKTHPVMIFQYNSAMQYLFSGLVTVGSLSSVKTELRARCNLWKKKKNISCHISSVFFFSANIFGCSLRPSCVSLQQTELFFRSSVH